MAARAFQGFQDFKGLKFKVADMRGLGTFHIMLRALNRRVPISKFTYFFSLVRPVFLLLLLFISMPGL